jgi:hypothetical protein
MPPFDLDSRLAVPNENQPLVCWRVRVGNTPMHSLYVRVRNDRGARQCIRRFVGLTWMDLTDRELVLLIFRAMSPFVVRVKDGNGDFPIQHVDG